MEISDLLSHIWLEDWLIPAQGYCINNLADFCTKQCVFMFCWWNTILQWQECVVLCNSNVDWDLKMHVSGSHRGIYPRSHTRQIMLTSHSPTQKTDLFQSGEDRNWSKLWAVISIFLRSLLSGLWVFQWNLSFISRQWGLAHWWYSSPSTINTSVGGKCSWEGMI